MAHAALHSVDPVTVRANKLDLVERLADDLAHEIKNPLHSMVINLEVLKRRIARLPDEGSSDLMRYAGIINGELERVNARIELLLQVVRPDRAAEPVSLAAVVDDVLVLVDLERARRSLVVEYQPATRPLRGRIPRETARQLALDLLLTAIDSVPDGGAIRVTTDTDQQAERLELRLTPDDGANAEIQVGSGMLVVARALAATLGGVVDVKQLDPRGVSILLSLPIAPA
jgi:signal transduction histidine kinase